VTLWECQLTTVQVQRLVGLDCYRTLDNWVRTDLLPVGVPAAGIGRRRRWSFVDLIRARAVADLRRLGVSLQTIRAAVGILTEKVGEHDPLAQGRLVVAGKRLFWAMDMDMLLDVLRGQLAAGPLVILDVGAIARELQPKVLELCAA
jgi:DNA-binding transcriptional MerR regulator